MLYRPGVKAVQAGIRHAYAIKTFSDGTAFLQKKIMAPVRKRMRTMSGSTARSSSSKKSQAPNKYTPAQTRASSFRKGKPNTFKKPKKVKLPKGFRQKVNKALEPKEINGSWKQVSYDSFKSDLFVTNQQIVVGLGQITANDHSDWAFDPEDFLHAASVLWNDKVDSQTSRAWFTAGNLGILPVKVSSNNDIVSQPPYNSGAQTNLPMNMKLTVKTASETYKIKNNTQRTITMKIYLVSPKVIGAKTQTIVAPSGPTTISTTTQQYYGNPGQLWASSLKDQQASAINIAQSTVNDLYQNPKSNPSFNKYYGSDVTIVTLEPGQVYDYYIQGPSNLTINYKNLFIGGSIGNDSYYAGIQKYMRYPLITGYLDMVTDGTLSGRYPPSEATGAGLALSIERIMKFSLVMPENVGTKMENGEGGLATNQMQVTLDGRRDCYFHKIYTPIAATGPLSRIDVENPPIEIDQTI